MSKEEQRLIESLRDLIAKNAEDYVRLEREVLALKSERNGWLVGEQHMRIRLEALEAVWMVAEEFGFVGVITDCALWIEKLSGHGRAINLVQPVEMKLPRKHDWMPTTLNHGTLQCRHCLITDREAAVIAPTYCLKEQAQ